jgi:CubicO group peptidase (beta-lactamase class C family)
VKLLHEFPNQELLMPLSDIIYQFGGTGIDCAGYVDFIKRTSKTTPLNGVSEMAGVLRLLRWVLRGFALLIVGAAGWLYAFPPDLIRVGSNYAAKIVCSNVFISKRDGASVLADDVQAPGHWLLKYMRLSVDETAGTVTVGLAGIFGKGFAIHREGLGCVSVPDGDFARAKLVSIEQKAQTSLPDTIWPEGERIEASQDLAIAAVLDDVELQGPGMRAIVVVHNGRVIGERYGAGFSEKSPLLGWSMTKTVNAALIGTLVRDGKLGMGQKDLLPEWKSDARKDIALSDLMSMTSGLSFDENYGDVTDVTRMLYLEPDMAAFARDKLLKDEIGEVFNYSSGSAVLLSRVWQNALGADVEALSYPNKALFEPLGMTSAVLEADAAGTYVGSSYLYATARDWARFGVMIANGGSLNGNQILPVGIVNILRAPSLFSDTGFGPQYTQGQMWLKGSSAGVPEGVDPDLAFKLPDDAVWMRGHDGQSICIIPSKQLVVLRMGLTPSRLGYQSQGLVQRLLAVLPQT